MAEGYNNQYAIETLSPTVTRSTGSTVSSVKAKRYGHVIFLTIAFGSSSGESGENFFTGSISEIPLPQDYMTTPAFYGNVCILCSLSPQGGITGRITNGSISGAAPTFSYTYIE